MPGSWKRGAFLPPRADGCIDATSSAAEAAGRSAKATEHASCNVAILARSSRKGHAAREAACVGIVHTTREPGQGSSPHTPLPEKTPARGAWDFLLQQSECASAF